MNILERGEGSRIPESLPAEVGGIPDPGPHRSDIQADRGTVDWWISKVWDIAMVPGCQWPEDSPLSPIYLLRAEIERRNSMLLASQRGLARA